MPHTVTDRLALLYRASQAFNSSLDLDEVLNTVMDEVIAATRAERGYVVLRDERGRLVFRAARGMDHQTLEAPEFQISRGLVERVAQDGVPVLAGDAQQDERLNVRQSVVALGLRSILCVPLKLKDTISGVVYVDNRLQAGVFTPEDLDLLSAIASNAAIAIENARLYQLAVEKGRLERELQLARTVQTSLLPRTAPNLAGWQFAARWQPARLVAGDYYDFISGGRQPHYGLVIGDVSDKGIAAALFMALTRSTVRGSLMPPLTPSEGITLANRLLCADATNGMFVTLFYARLNLITGELCYVNAGHNPPLLMRAGDDAVHKLTLTGMALGIEEEARYAQRTEQLGPGDVLVMYTDGVLDAARGLEFFGEARLIDVLHQHRQGSAADLASALDNALNAFTAGAQPTDDITFVIVRRQ